MIRPPFNRTGKFAGCECEFDPYPEGDSQFGEESWHYRRCCEFCGHDDWWTLSCPHEKSRNCPNCGRTQTIVG